MNSPRTGQIDFGGMFRRPPPATLVLMVLTGVVSLVALVDSGAFGSRTVLEQVVFSPTAVLDSLRLWTPVSYAFLLPDPLWLLLHIGLTLWMFGAQLERQWGSQRYLLYFFGTVSGSALLVTLLALVLGPLRAAAIPGTWVVNTAIITGWVLMNWYASVYFFFIPVRAPTLLLLTLGLPALYALMGAWPQFLAILFAAGIAYLMLNKRGNPLRRGWLHLRAWWIGRRLQRNARHLRVVPPPPDDDRSGKPPHYLN